MPFFRWIIVFRVVSSPAQEQDGAVLHLDFSFFRWGVLPATVSCIRSFALSPRHDFQVPDVGVSGDVPSAGVEASLPSGEMDASLPSVDVKKPKKSRLSGLLKFASSKAKLEVGGGPRYDDTQRPRCC